MNIDDVRPWEFWAADAEEWDMIREVKATYRQAVADVRATLIPDSSGGQDQ